MEEKKSSSKIVYGVNDRMPTLGFILTSLQHMLLVVSVGLALPVAVANAAGLDVLQSASYMSATLFGLGLISVFQSFPGKYLGTGLLSLAVSDSAAIGCCCMAAEAGGMPLVFGLSVCSCIFRYVFGHFTFKLRKFFPPAATGTMVIFLGITLVPTSFKYFLGTAAGFDLTAFLVALATLIVMVCCTFFIKALKPYTTLVGIVFGYLLSVVTGVFDISTLSVLKESAPVVLPVYKDLSFSFGFDLLGPFLVIALASVIDNIGDFTATQAAADPDMKKADWKCIERGIRAEGVGGFFATLLGGSLSSTATANIGVCAASGVVCRNIAFLASAFLMIIALFPGITGILSMIPAPVLGAVIMYSDCYIFSSGFGALQKIELDDKKILTIFLSLGASISTLIPNLYSFLPARVQSILISPMVLGVVVLIIMTLFSKIGAKHSYRFSTGVSTKDVEKLQPKITEVSASWGTDRLLSRKLQIALSGVCESLYELDPDCKLNFTISYDELQVTVRMDAESERFLVKEIPGAEGKEGKKLWSKDIATEEVFETDMLALTVRYLNHMFDTAEIDAKDGLITIKIAEDL